MTLPHKPVVIVGAGMAGLTCAVYLRQKGIDALLLEASDGVGGRVRTDLIDGFRLDRGFQILLTAYPEARRLLNYAALDLKTFRSGALVRHEGNWMRFINPLLEPQSIVTTLASPIGTLADKIRLVPLLRRVQSTGTNEFFNQTATTTYEFLAHKIGFSEPMITRFFRPFFGGVFLEDALVTSSNFFEFCFKMFIGGDAAVPALGIGQIADQLAGRLQPGQIRLNTAVAHIDGKTLHLASGETISAETIVLAVDATQNARLLGQPLPTERTFNHTTCTYFSAPKSPNREHLLLLNTRRSDAVHNVSIMSDVAPAYAPTGSTLISVSTQGLAVVDEAKLPQRITHELTGWFGREVNHWRHLRSYHIPQALPAYGPSAVHKPLNISEHLYQCGDQTTYPSLNAAMQTGRQVAEMIAV
ncbi:MAG: FAD-dependent oxidoreductase [Bacteroidetes bacterium]|nr:FAD-dependent oxidoreductase [Fibrella sp.]